MQTRQLVKCGSPDWNKFIVLHVLRCLSDNLKLSQWIKLALKEETIIYQRVKFTFKCIHCFIWLNVWRTVKLSTAKTEKWLENSVRFYRELLRRMVNKLVESQETWGLTSLFLWVFVCPECVAHVHSRVSHCVESVAGDSFLLSSDKDRTTLSFSCTLSPSCPYLPCDV